MDKAQMEKISLERKKEILKAILKRTGNPSAEVRLAKDIAIIGVSGRYPMAGDLEKYWENLKNGLNCIQEVPADRWNSAEYCDESRQDKEKAYTRWAGFIEDVDKFDPLFFNISPLEAETTDPQERLLLQTVWEVLEDAGYSRNNRFQLSRSVGVFIGAMNMNYELIGGEEWGKSGQVGAHSSFWSLANRISYFFDWQGPSLTVDTACSSSLTAIHLACDSIKKGECETAIAGGVNLILHPAHLIRLCKMEMLSNGECCHSFGSEADGFVDGEGVGAVLLKPLEKAVTDGDPIYGVIKGSHINTGGKTSGYTVPNPNAQKELIIKALENAGVNPRTLSYIEAHGTGTALGDPIEISGLSNAFKRYTDAKQYCAIGSSKSNIGHLESAAGIAGLTKILLQLKYRQLVPTLHVDRVNPEIDFTQSPFYLQRELTQWRRPSLPENGSEREYPRRAGISSFGAGGANAHLIIEEYPTVERTGASVPDGKNIFLLSAKDRDRLAEYAGRMKDYLDKNRGVPLDEAAYTLQTGRELMEERLAVVVSGRADLLEKLARYCAGETGISGVYLGTITGKGGERLRRKTPETERALEEGDLDRLASLWVTGAWVDWSRMYKNGLPSRIHLPFYPFAKERYWVKISAPFHGNGTVHISDPVYQTDSVGKIDSSPKDASNTQGVYFYTSFYETTGDCDFKAGGEMTGSILIFGLGEAVTDQIFQSFQPRAIQVVYGDRFQKITSSHYEINPENEADYLALFQELNRSNRCPVNIVHWSGAGPRENTAENRLWNRNQEPEICQDIFAIFYTIQAYSKYNIGLLKRWLYAYQGNTPEGVLKDSLAAYTKSLGLVLPNLKFRSLRIQEADDAHTTIHHIFREIMAPESVLADEVCYETGQRLQKRIKPLELNEMNPVSIKDDGVYLITGGLGALGFVFAKYLLENHQARVILTGRSELNAQKKVRFEEINQNGRALYLAAEITDRSAMAGLIQKINQEMGPIHGVIHAAGLSEGQTILHRKTGEFTKTLAPKIKGTIILDEVTVNQPLDFFVLFSSVSSVIGDFGQCDYSIGNRFLDCYAAFRNSLRQENLRLGRTVSINWPLWEAGGMHLGNQEAERLYLKSSGMNYLDSQAGLWAFEKILSSGEDSVMVFAGDQTRINQFLRVESPEKQGQVPAAPGLKSLPLALTDLCKMAAAIIHLSPERIDKTQNLGDYGFDSISLREFSVSINKFFHIDTNPTLFFAESNLDAVSKFLVEHYYEKISAIYQTSGFQALQDSWNQNESTVENTCEDNPRSNQFPETMLEKEPVAIIGAAGIFPGSNNLEEFWKNLESGTDLITEIPPERWNWKDYYGNPKENSDKCNSKWGGFIRDVDKFDAGFFHISPLEAEMMDPQQRLFLQTVWTAIEDAGYQISRLSGPKTGVFVGAQFNDYYQLLAAKGEARAYVPTGNALTLIANRVSFLFDFRGPSEIIDTACSSGLVAVNRAVRAIQRGDCDFAIAGGVSLMLTPDSMVESAQIGVLSGEGKCKTFSIDADGYVKGEGVAAILLKPLSKAEADHDYIYAVIKGCSVNHGGKANSLTAPNPKAQAALIAQAHREAAFQPETITYLELHGTGTVLGDPVEVEGIKIAFQELQKDTSPKGPLSYYCGLGAVKTNIGHLEPASGVAGLIKVLLAMEHQELPRSLNFKELNPLLNLKDTPFYVVEQNRPWNRQINEDGLEIPRRAGVSSFGFGGTNAHVAIEEYIPKIWGPAIPITPQNPAIIVLSAKNEERLKAQVEQLLAAIKKGESGKVNLADMAYTLQVGREAMEFRLAMVVSSLPELEEKLTAFLQDRAGTLNLYYGQVKNNQGNFAAFDADEDLQKTIEVWISKRKYTKLLELWVNGSNFDWNKFYGDIKPRRISLPTYPFAKDRYWISEVRTSGMGDKAHLPTDSINAGMIHPLLHQNTSDLYNLRFSSTFTGAEFFLVGHVINGQRVLPGAAMLEMVRVAVERVAGTWPEAGRRIRIKNVIWACPIVVGDQPVQVNLSLYPEEDSLSGEGGELFFEIYCESREAEPEPVINSQGRVVFGPEGETPILDLKELHSQCRQSIPQTSELRGIEKIDIGQGQLLVKLALPPSIGDTKDQFGLHPSLLRSALEASVVLMMNYDAGAGKSFVPAALQEIEFYHNCTSSMWALVRSNQEAGNNSSVNNSIQKLDIDLCDETGRVCIRIKGIEMYETPDIQKNPAVATEEAYELMTFEEVLEEQPLTEGLLQTASPDKNQTLICFLSSPENQQAFTETFQTYDQQTGLKTRLIFISNRELSQSQSPLEYHIPETTPEAYQEVFQRLREDTGAGSPGGEVDAIHYLWALEDSRYAQDYTSIVYMLQAMASAKVTPRKVLFGAQFANDLDHCYLDSWIGFERTLKLLLPNTQVGVIGQAGAGETPAVDPKDWSQKLWREFQTPKAQGVLYQAGKRYIYQIRPTTLPTEKIQFKPGGTYLITGGCGGLGLLFAEHLARNSTATEPVKLILTGRGSLDGEKQSKIKALENLGSQVLYVQADVCDQSAMKKGLNRAKEQFGGIQGVIHTAGILATEVIFEGKIKSFEKVLDPKIKGTLALDELLRNEPLEFICYFSSMTAILGDFGSCAYAIGNRFQLAYARYRNQQYLKGLLPGKAIAICWPLWKDGGMSFGDAEGSKLYFQSSGQRYIEAAEGVTVFDRILAQNKGHHLVLVGKPGQVYSFLGLKKDLPETAAPSIKNSSSDAPKEGLTGDTRKTATQNSANSSGDAPKASARGRRPEMKGWSLDQCLEWDLKEIMNKLLRIPREKIERQKNLADYGFNSIGLTQFAIRLIKLYGIDEITPALFFKHSSLEKLIQYFLSKHQAVFQTYYQVEATTSSVSPKAPVAPIAPKPQAGRSRFLGRTNAAPNIPEPIAIIGMSGRFPEARNIEELWSIIISGRDVVREIPKERFDVMQYYGPSGEPGKTNCKWLGCVPGVGEFEPLFFEISPREAVTMDPRQRLLLEESWRALEDAGYGAEHFKTQKIGMFVGVEQGDYQLLTQGEGSATSNLNSILAARLAYFLNLNGPVLAVDTACSSGLVAAHQAVLSLRNFECDTAIAAGVNLLLTPEPFIVMSQAGMLSDDGKCFTFDKRANGMVPGEAIAVLIFKRLSQAQADGDPIYAVIKGSGINYDGKTNGITAPSGVSQTKLLKSVYDQHRVNPEDIQYIVTHGTGTKLGDPVEINALYDAFKDYTQKQGYCALTSVKPNIGHTFASSGLVSLISLVQALRYETIPGSIHFEQENDYINWEKSPFYVNKTNSPWSTAASGARVRMGAVSAFGMSGTNVHMVVHSYSRENGNIPEPGPYYLIVLSAKTPEALREKTNELIVFFENNTGQNLAQISYTLLEGRRHFDHRCAIVIEDLENAVTVLKQIGSGEKIPNLFQGKVPRDFTGQKAILEYTQDLIKQSHAQQGNKSKYQEILFALADLYCQGYDLDWKQLYPSVKLPRVHLPTYPFARETYWVSKQHSAPVRTMGSSSLQAWIHPLLHENTSDFLEQRFRSTFSGREFFLADHVITGQRVLPGVAYLEMARAAVQVALGSMAEDVLKEPQAGVQLRNVVWARPLIVEERPVQIHIRLRPEANGEISFDIYSNSEDNSAEPTIHSQGEALLRSFSEIPTLDLQALQAEFQSSLPSSKCYEIFRTMGIDYGPGFQGLAQIYLGTGQVLAKLAMPASVFDTGDQFALHPSMMDSALQAAIGLLMSSDGPSKPNLPFALQQLDIFGACTSVMWALVRYRDGREAKGRIQQLDIDLCDEQGVIRVRIKGFSTRVLEGEEHLGKGSSLVGTLMLSPVWKEQNIISQPADQASSIPGYNPHLIFLCEPGKITGDRIEKNITGARCFTLQSRQESIAERYISYTIQVFEVIQKILKEKPKMPGLIQIVVQSGEEQQLFAGLSGLLQTAQQENPKLMGQLIEVEAGEDSAGISAKLKENSRTFDQRIRYQNGKRWIAGWTELETPTGGASGEDTVLPWKERGTYLITGGAGGLGLIFTKEIVEQVKDATIILVGRSSLNEVKKAQLREMGRAGARIEYRQVDITDRQAVADLVQNIQAKFGGIHGIIHGAGIIRDNYILKKTKEEVQEVLYPKVQGLVNLDLATKDLDLDFFVCFSSGAGTFGNMGQADYSAANAFMDIYAKYRNAKVALGQCKGQTLSINWPLWKDGGMRVDQETEKMLKRDLGMVPMQTSTGIRVFYRGLASGKDQTLALEGQIPQMKQKLFSGQAVSGSQTEKEAVAVPAENQTTIRQAAASGESSRVLGEEALREQMVSYLKQVLSSTLSVKPEQMDININLDKYGLDSIIVLEINNKLKKDFSDLSKTLFFEYSTIHDLVDYFLETHQGTLERLFKPAQPQERSAPIHRPVVTNRDQTEKINLVKASNEPAPRFREVNLKEQMITYLKQILSGTLRIEVEQLDINTNLDKYGLDSIMVLEVNNKLKDDFADLSKTLFFEYSTIHDLADYFVETHPKILEKLFQVERNHNERETSNQILSQPVVKSIRPEYPSGQLNRTRFGEVIRPLHPKGQPVTADSAGFLLDQLEKGALRFDDIIRLPGIGLDVASTNRGNEKRQDALRAEVSGASQDGPGSLLIHETELGKNPEIAALIQAIDQANPPIGYERLLYEYFFITAKRDQYLRVTQDASNKLIIPFIPLSRDIYQELLQYCQKNGQRLLLVDFYHEWIDPRTTRLIPLGVWQNIDIGQFTTSGNRMRKLRYLVEKFKNSGEVKVEEYHGESSLPLVEMKDLILKWSQSKKNIIQHTYLCMMELLQQRLSPGYRAFLTYHNHKLCSIIVIEKNAEGLYLMDQEFYDPETAPLGHMEYAIVEIMSRLKKENAPFFSLGLTWYPFAFEDNPHKDPEGWEWLKAQNEKQTLLSRIFQQGETNYQFKKKFGVVGEPIFAYVPNKAPFSILMNYWPIFYQNSMTAAQLAEQINQPSIPVIKPGPESETSDNGGLTHPLTKNERLELLAKHEKLEEVNYSGNPLDLMTDSWFYNQSDAVKNRRAYLKTKPLSETSEVLRSIFPFKHFILTTQGRIAEMLFYEAYPKEKKKIVTAISWTSTLMSQLNNGYEVIELPSPLVMQPQSPEIFKGEMDLEALREQLNHAKGAGDEIALVGMEVLCNGSGGHPVRLSHLRSLKTILEKYKIPLVLDASRIVRNAFLIRKYEDEYRRCSVWDIVKQTSQQAEYIVTSLTKDFAVPVGGLIATNDDGLAEKIKKIQSDKGLIVDQEVENIIIKALSEKEAIIQLVSKQLAFTKRVQDMLAYTPAQILRPAYGHAIVINVAPFLNGETAEETNAQKKERFLKKLFLETGIRGGIHQIGKQKNTPLDQCIRLAFPLGLTQEDEQLIYHQLHGFFMEILNLNSASNFQN